MNNHQSHITLGMEGAAARSFFTWQCQATDACAAAASPFISVRRALIGRGAELSAERGRTDALDGDFVLFP